MKDILFSPLQNGSWVSAKSAVLIDSEYLYAREMDGIQRIEPRNENGKDSESKFHDMNLSIGRNDGSIGKFDDA